MCCERVCVEGSVAWNCYRGKDIPIYVYYYNSTNMTYSNICNVRTQSDKHNEMQKKAEEIITLTNARAFCTRTHDPQVQF